MKASYISAYGSPEVVEIRDLAKPSPKDNEILIKLQAASIGPADCAFRKGEPFLVRLIYGFSKPKFPIGGAEFAGEIEAIGKDVKSFQVGQQVFGMTASFGAHAEYLSLPEDKDVILKPSSISPIDAVGLLDGGCTALTFLRDTAKIQRGQRVLINGASGAVGAYGVQLAKYYGAEVTGVCSAKNLELVKSLGADKVIDYTQEDFTKNVGAYDIIFDAVGKSSFSACKNALTPKGIYLTTVPSLAIVRDILRTLRSHGKKARFVTAGLMQNKDNLHYLKDLFVSGKLRAVIDRCYPLDEIVEAYRYVETERKKGNVVLTIAEA